MFVISYDDARCNPGGDRAAARGRGGRAARARRRTRSSCASRRSTSASPTRSARAATWPRRRRRSSATRRRASSRRSGADVERVRAGDRVVVAGTPECGECFWCVRDQPDQCAEMLGGILPPRVVATRARRRARARRRRRRAPSPSGWCCATAAWSRSTRELSDEHLSLLGLRRHRGRRRGPQPRAGAGRLVGGGRRLRRARPVDDPGGAGGRRDDDRRRGAARRAP